MTPAAKPDVSVDPTVGETLSVPERVIVAPATGVFRLLDGGAHKKAGDLIARGDSIALVQSLHTATPVRSPFGGMLVGFLALEGERVRPGQAVAWLRATCA